MKNLLVAALGAFAYEYLRSKKYIKGFKIDDRPVSEQAMDVIVKPTQLFAPSQELNTTNLTSTFQSAT